MLHECVIGHHMNAQPQATGAGNPPQRPRPAHRAENLRICVWPKQPFSVKGFWGELKSLFAYYHTRSLHAFALLDNIAKIIRVRQRDFHVSL